MVDRYLRKYYTRINNPVDQDVLITGMLHDILEDTQIPTNELKQFGWNVYWDVIRLSRIKPPVKYYKQISFSNNATIVKYADRICNLKSSIQDNNFLMMRKYLNEKKPFSRLYSREYKYLYYDLQWLYLKAWIKLNLNNLSSLIHL
jgi:(p)ppGpp synthase/HD superfamily hydrolase